MRDDARANAPRRRGRPALETGKLSAPVNVRLMSVSYDDLYALAKRRGLDVSTLIREAIDVLLVEDRRTHPRRAVDHSSSSSSPSALAI